jgi:hypothetical protein
MIVRVSARGQANGSADGYLCAREQLEQAERAQAKRRFLRVPSVTWFNFGNLIERFSSGAHGELHAVRGVLWGSKPRSRLPR